MSDIGPDARDAVSACWGALGLLADRVRGEAGPVRTLSLLVANSPGVSLGSLRPPPGDGWKVSLVLDGAGASDGESQAMGGGLTYRDLMPAQRGESRFVLDHFIVMRCLAEGDLPAPAVALLETYLPYCLAPMYARRRRRPFTVSHFAQSLDGRIATDAGDSRWIGCPENRVHAHRMRALCDGILIGAQTLRTDRPALTVRHAEGADPARIVVGGAVDDDDLGCLERAGSGPILLIGSRNGDGSPGAPGSPEVERVLLASENGRISTTEILSELYTRGILSVYIEGGATTTSAFLAEGNIDILQLHTSPMIIGPGVNSFSGPTISSVADSVRFDAHVYRPVGDGMMFVGRVAS